MSSSICDGGGSMGINWNEPSHAMLLAWAAVGLPLASAITWAAMRHRSAARIGKALRIVGFVYLLSAVVALVNVWPLFAGESPGLFFRNQKAIVLAKRLFLSSVQFEANLCTSCQVLSVPIPVGAR